MQKIRKLFNRTTVLILLTLATLLLATVIFTACSAKEKKAIQKYGQSKAFIHTSNGKDTVLGSSRIDFYLPPEVTGDYRKAMEYAIAKANAVSSKLTFTTNGTSSSNFKVQLKEVGSSSSTNGSATVPRSEKRYSSTVTFYTKAMNKKSLAYKKHTALHELGHVFGLDHQSATAMYGYTVMTSSHPILYQLSDYTKFDKYNITWKYGN